jgi:RNA polymerase-binding transcription factor DksA
MDASKLTAAQRRRLGALLNKRREEAEHHLAVLRESMGEVQSARADASADDEHDPEGPTMSQEWSSLTGLVTDGEAQLRVVDAALTRMHDGTYGICVRCGNPNCAARLEARPAAELCIDCARLAG